MADLADYVEAALLKEIATRQNEVRQVYMPRDSMLQELNRFCPVDIRAEILDDVLVRFIALSRITTLFDEISGDFFRLSIAKIVTDYSANQQNKDSLLYKYSAVGVEFLANAVSYFDKEAEYLVEVPIEYKSAEAPGSDRIIRFDDNYQERDNLIGGLQDLAQNIRETNDPDGKLEGDRGRIVAELSAGIELLKGPSVRQRAVLTILISALTYVANAFLGGVIGELAVQLMHHVNQVLGLV